MSAFNILYAPLTRGLFAIAKFLFSQRLGKHSCFSLRYVHATVYYVDVTSNKAYHVKQHWSFYDVITWFKSNYCFNVRVLTEASRLLLTGVSVGLPPA